jgi:hypothetical protein
MYEPGTGSVRPLPATVETFHEQLLVEMGEAALAISFFGEWARATERRHLPLQRWQCVGYRVPLFLNGADEVANLEVSDLEVYWSLLAQVRTQAHPGRRIGHVSIE